MGSTWRVGAGHARPVAVGHARPLLIVLAAVLLIRLPFLNQAIQGDDVYYLAGAQHAQIDPLHPNHARYAFLGQIVPMQGHPHPPLNAWFLALLLWLFGDIYEVPYHAAWLVFTVVAALAVWSLAQRFSPRPLAATLLFLATPSFVVNGNSLEADVPFLAFWLASIALFVHRRPALAVPAMVLAALAAYQAVVMIPILWVYLWLHDRKWRAGWIVSLTPAVTLVAWQAFERASTGELPAAVLAGFFQTYGLQSIERKLSNAAALTAHLGWLVFPLLALVAFRAGRLGLLAVAAAAAGAVFIDPHPLFWLSFGASLLLLLHCARSSGRGEFLSAWILLFFAASLVLFFAGSARYLLPIAAPVALLASVRLAHRPAWLYAAFGVQLLVGLSLALVNYQHWDGYRQFARSLAREAATRRVWINGEWGLRYYFEAEGGLALLRGQAVQPGDIVVWSRLAYPVPFTTGGGALAPVREQEIRASLPFRLIALGARSAYSTASFGLRPFDLARGPIDIVRADAVIERPPALEYLPMNVPEAEQQIVSGLHQLEENRFRWMGARATVLLKRPTQPAPLHVVFYIPEQAPARRVSVSIDGAPVAERTFAAPGAHTLVCPPVAISGLAAAITITVDRTFSVPGDHRELGIILSEVGFRR